MMTTLTLPAHEHTASKPCHCGCQSTHDRCCRLDCIKRPRFFCGQLLTDQDLSALVEWTDRRLRLSRFRHGWGVVCGLDVRCDPKHHGGLIVTPGYAIGCCGEDIVVCKDAPLDLSKWCKPPVDPCADFRRPPVGAATEVQIGCLRVPVNELRIFDVSIGYDEKLTDPQTALGRGLCHRDAECEFTRAEESYLFSIAEGTAASDPLQSAVETWLEEYRKCSRIVDEYYSRFAKYRPTDQDFGDVRQWLLKWLEVHPLREFCFVRECICDAQAPPDEREIVRWLFWIVQDCRNAHATVECHPCPTSTGVALARIWLRVRDTHCTVVRVDSRPPYRRPVGRDGWPAASGSVNAARWLWRRHREICSEAAALGVDLAPREVELRWPSTIGELRDLFDTDPFVDCGEQSVAQVLDTGMSGPRIVGFTGQRRRGSMAATAAAAPQQPVENDLTELPHVGPARADDFKERGITTYAQIGAMTREELHQYLPKLADGPLDEVIRRANELAAQAGGGNG